MNKAMNKKIAVIWVLLSLAPLSLGYRASRSGNVYETNGSASDVQRALDAAPSGATIKIPAGKFQWTQYVNGARGVYLEGAGVDKTTIETVSPQAYTIVCNLNCDSSPVIVEGISWTNQLCLQVSGNPSTATFRVYNCTFDGGTAQVLLFQTGGNGKGLVD